MIEPKGKLKFNKLEDGITLEVCDENGCKVWTIDTISQSLVTAEKTQETLSATKAYLEKLLEEAKKLGIKTPKEAAEEKAKAEATETKAKKKVKADEGDSDTGE